MFERNCGATTGFSTQVSVLRKSPNLPNGSGNVFVADGAPWTRDLAPSLFGMKWQNAKTLQINHPAGVRIYKSKKTIGGVAIQLNPVESQIPSR